MSTRSDALLGVDAEDGPTNRISDDDADRDRYAAFTDRNEYPLLVITTVSSDGERSGCLAGFASQCSIEPLRFLACISRANHTFGVVQRATVLALHLLGAEQTDTAALFGSLTGDEIDKFAHVGWHEGPRGIPILDDCAAWVAGEILVRVNAGDHEAHIIRPLDGGDGSKPGLLTNCNAPDLPAGHPAE